MRREDIRPAAVHVIQATQQDSPTPFVVSSARVVGRFDDTYSVSIAYEPGHASGIIGLTPMIGTKEQLALLVRDFGHAEYRREIAPAVEAATTMRHLIDGAVSVNLGDACVIAPPRGWRWETVMPRQLKSPDFWDYVAKDNATRREVTLDHERRAAEAARRAEEFRVLVDQIVDLANIHGLDVTEQRYFTPEGEAWHLVVDPASLLKILRELDAKSAE